MYKNSMRFWNVSETEIATHSVLFPTQNSTTNILLVIRNSGKRLADQMNVVNNDDVYPSHSLDLPTTLSAPYPPFE